MTVMQLVGGKGNLGGGDDDDDDDDNDDDDKVEQRLESGKEVLVESQV